jgi:diaminopropionate ammonia-lyase
MSKTGKIEFITNARYDAKKENCPDFLSVEQLKKVRHIHDSIPDCMATPLVQLSGLAEYLGVKSVFVKNESKRGTINSFKILGATYAVSKLICDRLGLDVGSVTFDSLKSPEVQEKIKGMTLSTCSDGNHGRGVAWTAKQLGLKAVIYMPKGTAESRVKNIEALGAAVTVTAFNYDDTVRYANEIAGKNGWYVVQDTSWEGYKEVPTTILQGYSTMGMEAIEQLEAAGFKKPTHIFVQAGVGAMASGVIGAVANYYEGDMPTTVIMEPTNAACYYKSAEANDGEPRTVGGEMESIMAGLACGEPIREGWEIIRDFAFGFFRCPDYVTANGMRILANPIGNDEKVVSGESGAVGAGLLAMIITDPEYAKIKDKLGMNKDSVVLMFSTEGDTDPVNYRNILWYGAYSSK